MTTNEIRVLADGSLTSTPGFKAGAVYAGIKTPGPDKLDVGMIVSDVPCVVAATFTQNRFAAAPVGVSREHVARMTGRGIVFNAGNANACTGEQGLRDALEMTERAATKIGDRPEAFLVASTGVIGVPMDMDKIRSGIESIQLSDAAGHAVARAMMTTDTRPKEIAVEIPLSSGPVILAGATKGAGMIHPNMATMLCFLTTNAVLQPDFAHEVLLDIVNDTFNMISIDRDTSTNDSVMLLANGLAGNEPLVKGDDAFLFAMGLRHVCTYLATSIVRDGEGMTKFFEVRVRGARSPMEARLGARAVVASNLVKTALYGADPNWGRILAAMGNTSVTVDPTKVDVSIGDAPVCRGGSAQGLDKEAARAVLQGSEIVIQVDLHMGESEATAWGCDLTEGYVQENSLYTT
ncbi:MAG: bifunctional glutamate N-acetyltransferase/amino-acid acetyltransferase ArgJ [Chloroflexota bacterium]